MKRKIKKLIEPAEDNDDLTTQMRILDLFKNYRKQKINITKDEYLYIDCIFILDQQLVQKDYSVIANTSKQKPVLD